MCMNQKKQIISPRAGETKGQIRQNAQKTSDGCAIFLHRRSGNYLQSGGKYGIIVTHFARFGTAARFC